MELTLKEWRRVKEMSQDDAAAICGVHANTYRAWENNPGEMRLSAVCALADALGISISDIILPADTTKRCIDHKTEG